MGAALLKEGIRGPWTRRRRRSAAEGEIAMVRVWRAGLSREFLGGEFLEEMEVPGMLPGAQAMGRAARKAAARDERTVQMTAGLQDIERTPGSISNANLESIG